jgi:hypothetical protein
VLRFFQEMRADHAAEKLQAMVSNIPPTCSVPLRLLMAA